MAKNHGILISSHLMAWNNDALTMCGVYADGDLDNGQLVTLNGIRKDVSTGAVQGYDYAVKPATAGADNVWLVESPELGYTLETQIHEDPRYFYNEAGKPMSLRAIMGGVDCFEITKELFASGTLPVVGDIGKYVAPAANGKYAAPAAEAPVSGAYFRIEGLTTIKCGFEEIPAVLLRCIKNYH